VFLKGTFGEFNPTAATVPRTTASAVLKIAITKEFLIDIIHLGSLKKASYHLNENPAGSRVNISLENEKNEPELNDSGTNIKIGNTKNKNTQ
jgi:uncharacterized protein YcbX